MKKDEPIQWTAKAAKNSKPESIQVASSKKSIKSVKFDKNSKTSSKVAVLDKKSLAKSGNKNTSLTAQLAANKSNYRKASVAIAKADTKGSRSNKKLKGT